jgi:hypothetical protein
MPGYSNNTIHPNNKRRIARKENHSPQSARLRPRDSLRHPQQLCRKIPSARSPRFPAATVSYEDPLDWLRNDLLERSTYREYDVPRIMLFVWLLIKETAESSSFDAIGQAWQVFSMACI